MGRPTLSVIYNTTSAIQGSVNSKEEDTEDCYEAEVETVPLARTGSYIHKALTTMAAQRRPEQFQQLTSQHRRRKSQQDPTPS